MGAKTWIHKWNSDQFIHKEVTSYNIHNLENVLDDKAAQYNNFWLLNHQECNQNYIKSWNGRLSQLLHWWLLAPMIQPNCASWVGCLGSGNCQLEALVDFSSMKFLPPLSLVLSFFCLLNSYLGTYLFLFRKLQWMLVDQEFIFFLGSSSRWHVIISTRTIWNWIYVDGVFEPEIESLKTL